VNQNYNEEYMLVLDLAEENNRIKQLENYA
jgi:hypothetical protein